MNKLKTVQANMAPTQKKTKSKLSKNQGSYEQKYIRFRHQNSHENQFVKPLDKEHQNASNYVKLRREISSAG